MFWFISPVAVYAQCKCVDCLRVCVFVLPLFGLVKFRLRSLIGLSDWIIKSDKSGRQAKTIRNVAGGKFTRGFAARDFPRGLREKIWRLRRSLARSRIPPATQANSVGPRHEERRPPYIPVTAFLQTEIFLV